MKLFGFVAFYLTSIVAASPVEIFEDENDQDFFLVPVSRGKRETTDWGITRQGVDISHTGIIYRSDNHQFDGTASATKYFPSPGVRPDQVGGRLEYTNIPSGSGAFIQADRKRNVGTDVTAGAKYNIYTSPKKDFGLDATAQFRRHYEGPGGAGHADGEILLKAKADI